MPSLVIEYPAEVIISTLEGKREDQDEKRRGKRVYSPALFALLMAMKAVLNQPQKPYHFYDAGYKFLSKVLTKLQDSLGEFNLATPGKFATIY